MCLWSYWFSLKWVAIYLEELLCQQTRMSAAFGQLVTFCLSSGDNSLLLPMIRHPPLKLPEISLPWSWLAKSFALYLNQARQLFRPGISKHWLHQKLCSVECIYYVDCSDYNTEVTWFFLKKTAVEVAVPL